MDLLSLSLNSLKETSRDKWSPEVKGKFKKGIVAIILEVNATSQSLIPRNQRDKFLSKKKDGAFH